MKVLHISYAFGTRGGGGAAAAATRLHLNMLKRGVDSRAVCVWGEGESVVCLRTGWWWLGARLLHALTGKWTHGLDLPGFDRMVRDFKPDEVHVHWIRRDTVSWRQLKRVASSVHLEPSPKLFVHLHDLWPLEQKQITSLHPTFVAYSNWVYEKVRNLGHAVERRDLILDPAFSPSAVHLPPPSSSSTPTTSSTLLHGSSIPPASPTLLHGQPSAAPTTSSTLLHGQPSVAPATSSTLLHGQNSTVLLPPSPSSPPSPKIILFGCKDGRANPDKGFSDLARALALLPEATRNTLELRVFGESAATCMTSGVRTVFLGRMDDPVALRDAYRAASCFAFPSVHETMGMTKLEALACGCPVVAFDREACAEGIAHGKTGYVAKDVADFAAGLQWALRRTV